jgi:hypothetical protein
VNTATYVAVLNTISMSPVCCPVQCATVCVLLRVAPGGKGPEISDSGHPDG